MRAEDTLQYMADFYPNSYPTRKHCLNQLFCVIVNGYKWIDGELVAIDNRYTKRYMLIHPIERAEFMFEDSWYRLHNYYKGLYEDGLYKIPYEYQFEWHPLSKKYSALFTYPEDIKDDWKALLEECKSLLIADGIDIEIDGT